MVSRERSTVPLDYVPHSKAALNTSPCKRHALDLLHIDSALSNMLLNVGSTVASRITDAVPGKQNKTPGNR